MTDLVPLFGFQSAALLMAVAAIVMAAALVQSGLGMGFGMTAAPLLALIDPELVPGPILFLAMLTAGWGAWSERDGIRWSEVGVSMIGRTVGVAAASLLLLVITDRDIFMLAFGLLVLTAVALTAGGWGLAFNTANLTAMSALSGLMATFTSVGAPPMALAYHARKPAEARPTLNTYFALGCAIALAGLYATGWAGLRDLWLAVLMLPAMLLGLTLSRHVERHLSRRYRPALLTVSAAAALILIIRGLT